jgi:integrase-like protein
MKCSSADRRSPLGLLPGHPAPRLYDRVVKIMRARHYSVGTQQTYRHWVKRFIYFHNVRHPADLVEQQKDLAGGWSRAQSPDAVDRKYPNAPADWRWKWVFPQEDCWKNRNTGEEGQHHIDESSSTACYEGQKPGVPDIMRINLIIVRPIGPGLIQVSRDNS